MTIGPSSPATNCSRMSFRDAFSPSVQVTSLGRDLRSLGVAFGERRARALITPPFMAKEHADVVGKIGFLPTYRLVDRIGEAPGRGFRRKLGVVASNSSLRPFHSALSTLPHCCALSLHFCRIAALSLFACLFPPFQRSVCIRIPSAFKSSTPVFNCMPRQQQTGRCP